VSSLLPKADDRYQKQSTLITSQLPVTNWHEYLDEATLADAILDRLLDNLVRKLVGDSMHALQAGDAYQIIDPSE
jgi:DNA replication protein DnaC